MDCTHQAVLPPVCVADHHFPCSLQPAKRAFSLKEHSRVRLIKDDVSSGKLDVASVTRAFLNAVVAWRWVSVMIAASRAWAVSTLRWRSWMSHLLIVDAHIGVAARLRYLDKGVELLPLSRSSSRPGCRQARSTSGGSSSILGAPPDDQMSIAALEGEPELLERKIRLRHCSGGSNA